MHPDLALAILAASRELHECAECGEHPAGAVQAVRSAYSLALALSMHGRGEHEWAMRLSAVLGLTEQAATYFRWDRERASEEWLPQASAGLAKLVRLAEAAREMEMCAA